MQCRYKTAAGREGENEEEKGREGGRKGVKEGASVMEDFRCMT